MKKLLFPLLLAVASFGVAQAQNRSVVLKSDGTVEDGHTNTLGYIKSDGSVEDSHRNTIGYIKSDGSIEDSHRNTIGYFKSGIIEDSHRNTIGRESSMSRNEVAVRYFFFK